MTACGYRDHRRIAYLLLIDSLPFAFDVGHRRSSRRESLCWRLSRSTVQLREETLKRLLDLSVPLLLQASLQQILQRQPAGGSGGCGARR